MPLNIDIALKKDYALYKKAYAALQKQKKEIEKKKKALDRQYSNVLDLVYPDRKKKKGKRAKRGQSNVLILKVVTESDKPLKAIEIINKLKGKLSAASVRMVLPKLVKGKKLAKSDTKEYSIYVPKPKTKLRKKSAKKAKGK